jgi:hypothetical protein
VRRLLLYILSIFPAIFCNAQRNNAPAASLGFADSVRLVLENTKNVDATIIGSGMNELWDNLTMSQQRSVQSQAYIMRKKKFPLKPHIVNYFGAIVNAVTVEKADAATLSSYLTVAGKVLENFSTGKANNFFASARTFFQFHALHYERDFKLLVEDKGYKFEFVEPAPLIGWNDTTALLAQSTDGYPATSDETADKDDTEDSDSGDTVQETMQPWMNLPPPPTLEGAVLRFQDASLFFITAHDSVSLRNTKGAASFTEDLFVGDGGKFDWSAAGLSPDSVYCNLTSYFFNIKKPEIKSDLVKLTYLGKTPGFIPGSFEFKSVPHKDYSSYPRFKSYESNLNITGLSDENVRYKGGFSLTGSKISSVSFNGEPATVEIYNRGSRKLIARSTNFEFTPTSIISPKTQVSILHANDSIVHPVVRMKYVFASDSTQKLLLQKDKGDMRYTPYASTFFGIDFAADVLQWDLSADSLNMLTEGGRSTVPVIIESVDYYDPEDYRVLQGVGFPFHPLALVINFAQKKGITEFYTGELASYANRDLNEIKRAILFLYQKGMVNYNQRSDFVQIKPKAFGVVKAFRGQMDYDNLKIHSVIDSLANATINFKDRYMTVRGVEEFDVSDSLNVHIKPDSSIITILQNRDIKFDGTIDAGNFQISGKGFTLRYDSFLIDLKQIDSVNFYVTEKNTKGQEIRRKISNSMVGTDSTAAAVGGMAQNTAKSGTLFISRANNKSGKEKVPNYPRLDASSGGVIYFDRKEVLGGVYDRSMFFVVPPFKLDSLNDADPASINFDGTFVSSGMFPSFKEKLHTQPDKSLGFEHPVPEPGYQLYNGDGVMNGVLTMDNRGLRGLGTIDYLATSVSSKDFVYYPDSVITQGTRAKIAKKQFGSVIFPEASLSNYDMKWYPKEDRMIFKNQKAPFNFYDSTAQMQGTVVVSKNGVGGAGKLQTRGTELVSRDMRFSGDDFGARHARFKVKTTDPDKPLFTGNDIRLKFNLVENYADISPEVEGVAAIDFPYAQVKTSIQKARWDLDEQKIVMSKDPSVDIENSYFYTTRKELDSLHFNADRAEYNLKTQELKVSGIPYIIVADAKITPENNEVLILENAKIGTLKNTTIVLDTLNGYHRLTEGVVDIVSRKQFNGYATYQYVNLLNDTFAIKMTDFHMEPITPTEGTKRARRNSIATMQTVATGSVSEEEKIVLGAGLYYKGDMIMYATRPALQLDGYVKLDIRNIKDYNAWLKYQQSGEETDVLIDFDNTVTEEGKKATAGLHFGSADNQLYVTFMNDRKSDDDEDFFTPSGTLVYDKEVNEYRIEDREKAAGNKLSGKIFTYNDEKQTVRFEGEVKPFSGFKDFNITASSIGSGDLQTNEFKMNSLLVVDCNVPPTAFDLMARNLVDVIKNEGANEGLGDQTELLYKVSDLIGERAAKEYEQKSLQAYVSLATIPEFIKPLVFADVNLKWHAELKAFYSEGLLGVSNIGKTDINGGFEGFLEIKKSEDGAPVFHLFLKASPEAWYYFGFEDNRLLIHSSNGEFNDVISKKSNAGKAKVGELAFIPGSDDETLAFVNRFRKQYYGIDVPYNLSEGVEAVEKKKTEKKEEDDGF